jgi:tetratricopeptide (TPR) repeat protein
MHFQRFTVSDTVAHQQRINELQDQLTGAQAKCDAGEMLETAIDLAEALTIAEREKDARKLLLEHKTTAREMGRSSSLGWFELNLATANQYLGHKKEANEGFKQAVSIAEEVGDRELEHYVWHHWGRSLVEDQEIERAKECLEKALAIRRERNHAKQESTEKALLALSKLH